MSMRSFLTPARSTLPLIVVLASACAGGPTTQEPRPEAARAGGDDPAVITAEEIRRTPNQSVEKLLMGRFAGVSVRQTPHGLSVRIRGASSLQGGNEPLYVIDGLPIEPGPGGALAGISAQDIASIEVLKDAANTTMYGVRGANGVIVIRTKSPDQ